MAEILLVDDDEVIHEIISEILSSIGHRVSVIDRGLKALQQIEALRPALLITDIYMPDCDGIEVLLQVKKNHPDLPVLSISSDANYLRMSHKLGADAVLEKPLDPALLIQTVDRLLARSPQARA